LRQPTQSHDALLLLCDISGYTRFVTANRETLAHSYVIILELMQALTQQVRVPFEIAKLEGDAVFLFSWLPAEVGERQRTMANVLELMQEMFAAYDSRLEELKATNICPCEACVNAQQLDLKIIAHLGPALMHRIGKFSELSGVDVILAHRLLKNSLPLHRYILITQAVHALLPADSVVPWEEGAETYENLGTTHTFIYVPAPGLLRAGRGNGSLRATVWQKTAAILHKIAKVRALQFGLIRRPPFRHVPGDVATESRETQ
jgi:class 3 adenylate cyclase